MIATWRGAEPEDADSAEAGDVEGVSGFKGSSGVEGREIDIETIEKSVCGLSEVSPTGLPTNRVRGSERSRIPSRRCPHGSHPATC